MNARAGRVLFIAQLFEIYKGERWKLENSVIKKTTAGRSDQVGAFKKRTHLKTIRLVRRASVISHQAVFQFELCGTCPLLLLSSGNLGCRA